MNDWQTPIALLVVLAAVAYLARCWWKSRQNPGAGCGSKTNGCGCASIKPRKR